jgi:serine/threonine protein kinase
MGRSRFLQEASTLARFRHPSVVQVTRVFEAFSTAYMVMAFEQGQSLERWLKHLGRPPTQEELDRIAGPILDALEMMHGESFLHRDIAPDNIRYGDALAADDHSGDGGHRPRLGMFLQPGRGCDR